MMEQVVYQRTEYLGVAMREESITYQIDCLTEFSAGFVVVTWLIALCFQRINLRCGQAEQKEVLLTNLIANLYIGAVECADSDGTIHGKLHVAGSGGLFASQGDLNGKLCHLYMLK